MEQLKNESSRQYEYMEEMKKWVQKKSGELGRKLTCHVTTFGCQMNEKDSEKLLGILETIGYEEVETEEADFLIFNTCTVRENANTKLYGHLGQVKKMKERNPQMMIGLCGCMMQEEHVIEKIRSSYKFVDIIFGTHNIFKLAELLKARVDSKGMIVDIWKDTDQIVEDLPSDRKFSFKCGVNIMYGCNNFCSYCIVPYVRGRERSRKPEDIIKEVKQVVSEGVKEVMLLGQNVNSYGKTLEEPMSFAELLREVEKVEGLERIRFMTPHPKDLSDDLIEVMATSKKVCKHMHLPMQSGSSRLLKLMNRHYTKEQYVALAKKIQERIPGVSFTTDIIVGFPGETEEDFQMLLDFLKEARLDRVGCFKYSPVEGADANALPDQVPEEVKEERWNRFMQLQQQISAERLQEKVGREILVIIDEVDEEGAIGRSMADAPEIDGAVYLNGETNVKPGDILRVKVEHADEYDLWGSRV